jgi:hypothetical protein
LRAVAKIFVGFFRGLWGLAWPWRIWVGLLILLNGIVPLAFLETLEARVVLLAFMVGAMLQMALFGARGFVRLLGMGHLVVWLPMLLWLWGRLGEAGGEGLFERWLLAVILADGLSLLIDAVDVVRYALGDRTPSLTLEDLE